MQKVMGNLVSFNVGNSTEVLYNLCFGGFRFSDEFISEHKNRFGESEIEYSPENYRIDANTIGLYKEFVNSDKNPNGRAADVQIQNVANNSNVYIMEYDGAESVIISDSPMYEL